MVALATGQKEAPPQWYDIDVVKGTQYTVTGYQVPIRDPGGEEGGVNSLSCSRVLGYLLLLKLNIRSLLGTYFNYVM